MICDYHNYNRLFMRPRNLCILAKNSNLWITFMRGSTWGMAIFTVDIHYVELYVSVQFQFNSHNHINIILAPITGYMV